jgi:hypothetical protein
MDTTYADACIKFEDRVNNAIVRAEEEGLTPAEIAAELRRIADLQEEG